MRDSQKEVSNEKVKTQLHLKRSLYCFQLKRGLSIDDHTNNYTKVLADSVNVDVAIEEVLLDSLPNEEYETFVLTLINNKQTFNYSDVSATLIN